MSQRNNNSGSMRLRISAKTGVTAIVQDNNNVINLADDEDDDDEWIPSKTQKLIASVDSSDDDDERVISSVKASRNSIGIDSARSTVPSHHDFHSLILKADHLRRAIWVCPNGRIFLDTNSVLYQPAYDFLIAIADPVCRPKFIHEYQISSYSLYAAASLGLTSEDILSGLQRLSKVQLPDQICDFVKEKTTTAGKVKLLLRRTRYFIESIYADVLEHLLKDPVIVEARIDANRSYGISDVNMNVDNNINTVEGNLSISNPLINNSALQGSAAAASGRKYLARVVAQTTDDCGMVRDEKTGYLTAAILEPEIALQLPGTKSERIDQRKAMGILNEEAIEKLADSELPPQVLAFEIDANRVEDVRRICNNINYPLLEEYDFRHDNSSADLPIALKPSAQIRDYQEKSLSKMFGNGRARSGIIVLPCGAGKCWGRGTKLMLYDGSMKCVEDVVAGDFLMGDDSTPRRVLHGTIIHGNTMKDAEEFCRQVVPHESIRLPAEKLGHHSGGDRRGQQSDGMYECKYEGCLYRSSTLQDRAIHEKLISLHALPARGEPAMYRITSTSDARSSWTCNNDHILVLKFCLRPSRVTQWPIQTSKPYYYSQYVVETTGPQTGLVVDKAFSFESLAEAVIAQGLANANWHPLEWEASVDTFLRCSPSVQANAKMFTPQIVHFPPPKRSLQHRLSHILQRPVSSVESIETAWVLGMWATDGSIGFPHVSHTHSYHSYTSILERLDRWCAQIGPPLNYSNTSVHPHASSTDVIVHRIWQSDVLMKLLASYDADLTTSATSLLQRKHFPLELLREPHPVRMAIATGLIGGAGQWSEANYRFELTFEDQHPIDGLLHLFRGLGFSATKVDQVVSTTVGTEDQHIGWGLFITGNRVAELLTTLSYKRGHSNPIRDTSLEGFIVTKEPHGEYFGFRLDGNGRCLLEDFVITHNTLVGITATATVKKSTLVYCTTGVAVDQWRRQFLHWSTLPAKHICVFTSSIKQRPTTESVILITTYNMVSFAGRRSAEADEIMSLITSQEWGLVVCDEVHVAPAKMFRRCVSITHSRCFDPHTKVLMGNFSIKEIKDIKLNDTVWGDDNTLRHVTGIIPIQKGVMYRVTQSQGSTYYVNHGHLLVLRVSGVAAHIKKRIDHCGIQGYYCSIYVRCQDSGLCSNTYPCNSFKDINIRCESRNAAENLQARYNLRDPTLVIRVNGIEYHPRHFVHDGDEFILPVEQFNSICTTIGRTSLKGFKSTLIPKMSPAITENNHLPLKPNYSTITVSIANSKNQYCGIQVDGNNKFLLADYTVVHNCKLGLTATLVREDNLVEDLFYLIGPKLYEANWLDLQNAGHLATVQCIEVWCDMTAEFYAQYLNTSLHKQMLLYAMNPNKFRACEYLIQLHEARGDKVLVFSDNVFAIRHYAIALKKPFIYGATADSERLQLLHHFQHDPRVNTLFISKVGDNSIDLPDVNVIIQISSHFSSRRQEAQRLGRILRPKSAALGRFNAFFYTLVSRDTREMVYATKRQRFLVDQGYAFKVITSLPDLDTRTDLHYSSPASQHELLCTVMAADESEGTQEVVEDDVYAEMANAHQKRVSAQRRRGHALALTGADDRSYAEFERRQEERKGQGQKRARMSATRR